MFPKCYLDIIFITENTDGNKTKKNKNKKNIDVCTSRSRKCRRYGSEPYPT
jgi:hypothetical protein